MWGYVAGGYIAVGVITALYALHMRRRGRVLARALRVRAETDRDRS